MTKNRLFSIVAFALVGGALAAQGSSIRAAAPVERPAGPQRLNLPGAGFGRFRVQESPILAPELAALFPEIRTFVAAGVDDPAATARLDWTLEGFHAVVLRAGGTVYVDPYTAGDRDIYVSYAKAD